MKRRSSSDPQHPTGKRRKIARYESKVDAQAALSSLTEEDQRCTIICGNGQRCTGKRRITKNGSGKWVVSKHCSKTYKRHSVHGLSKEQIIHKIRTAVTSLPAAGAGRGSRETGYDTEALAKMPLKQLRDILYSAQEKNKKGREARRGLKPVADPVKLERPGCLKRELRRASKVPLPEPQSHTLDHQMLPPRVQLQTDVSQREQLSERMQANAHRLLQPVERLAAHQHTLPTEVKFENNTLITTTTRSNSVIPMVPIRFQPHAPTEGHSIMVPPRSPWAGPHQNAMVSRNSSRWEVSASNPSPGTASAECTGLPSPWFPGTPPLHLGVPATETHPVQYIRGVKEGTVFHVGGSERLQYEVPQHQAISWEFAPSATSWVEMPQDEVQLLLAPHGKPEALSGRNRPGRLIHVRS